MFERRKKERRDWTKKAEFPLLDSEGRLVTHNRRRIVDRRGGIDANLEGSARDFGEAQRLRLRVNDHALTLSTGELSLGRSGQSDVVVQMPLVSRNHARFEVRQGRFYLVDQSRNGSYIRFHGEKDTHVVHGSELEIDRPGALALGHDFNQGLQPDVLFFDLEEHAG